MAIRVPPNSDGYSGSFGRIWQGFTKTLSLPRRAFSWDSLLFEDRGRLPGLEHSAELKSLV